MAEQGTILLRKVSTISVCAKKRTDWLSIRTMEGGQPRETIVGHVSFGLHPARRGYGIRERPRSRRRRRRRKRWSPYEQSAFGRGLGYGKDPAFHQGPATTRGRDMRLPLHALPSINRFVDVRPSRSGSFVYMCIVVIVIVNHSGVLCTGREKGTLK